MVIFHHHHPSELFCFSALKLMGYTRKKQTKNLYIQTSYQFLHHMMSYVLLMKSGSFPWNMLPLQASQGKAVFPSTSCIAQSLEGRLRILHVAHLLPPFSFKNPAILEAYAIKYYDQLS